MKFTITKKKAKADFVTFGSRIAGKNATVKILQLKKIACSNFVTLGKKEVGFGWVFFLFF